MTISILEAVVANKGDVFCINALQTIAPNICDLTVRLDSKTLGTSNVLRNEGHGTHEEAHDYHVHFKRQQKGKWIINNESKACG